MCASQAEIVRRDTPARRRSVLERECGFSTRSRTASANKSASSRILLVSEFARRVVLAAKGEEPRRGLSRRSLPCSSGGGARRTRLHRLDKMVMAAAYATESGDKLPHVQAPGRGCPGAWTWHEGLPVSTRGSGLAPFLTQRTLGVRPPTAARQRAAGTCAAGRGQSEIVRAMVRGENHEEERERALGPAFAERRRWSRRRRRSLRASSPGRLDAVQGGAGQPRDAL